MKSGLYTGTGDKGATSLIDGSRVRKDSLRLEAYGTVDEFSSFVGLIISHKDCPDNIKGNLLRVQSLLFDIGAILATPPSLAKGNYPEISNFNKVLETWIDDLDEATPKIRSFVLPGGSELSSHCHVARTVCRRAERRIISLSASEPVAPEIIVFFNRLSDYLFIAAKYVNHILNVEEITWQQTKPEN